MLALRKEHGGRQSRPITSSTSSSPTAAATPSPGKVDFLDVTVNQGTDTVQVRAIFPNPNRVLVDGQLVTVVVEVGKSDKCAGGAAAGAAGRSGRHLRAGRRQGQQGRRSGASSVGSVRGARMRSFARASPRRERVITEGIQKVRPGQVVQPTEVKPEGVSA